LFRDCQNQNLTVMAVRISQIKTDGILSVLIQLFVIMSPASALASLQAQQLTQAEFSKELRAAYNTNDDKLAASLIKDHRLFVKAFVNDLSTESIREELKGNNVESGQARIIAEKTAATFENTFGERSLTVGVNYLKLWSKEQKRKKLVADSLYVLGTSIRGNAADRERAIEIHQRALDLYKEIGDERGEAEVLGGLGLICTFKNDYQTALSYYNEALIKREKVDDRLLIGNTVNSMGSIYYGIIKDYRIALPYFDRAEAIRTELGDSLNLGRTILLKASTLDNLGQFEPSLEYYTRACELNKVSGDQSRVAESLLKAGTVLNYLGKYPEALESLDKALEINKAINKSSGISEALNQTGYVYLKLGDLNKALDKFNEAIKITKDQNDKWGLAGVYNNLGIMLQNAGRFEKALEYYTNALNIYEELGDQGSVLILIGNIGTINFDLKDYAKAEEYHLKGLRLSRDLNSKDQEVTNLLNLANNQIYLGKFDEAMSNYNTGLIIAHSLNSPDLIWKITAGIAETWERKGNYEKAVELNDTVLKIIEGMRNTLQSDEQKSSFMASERYVFEDVINLLSVLHEKDGTKGYDKLAFQYSERSKSRAFLDLLAESLANVKGGENNELLNKQDELLTGLTEAKQLLEQESKAEQPDQQKINGIKEKIKITEEELNKLHQQIRVTNPRYADLHYPQPVSLEEVKALCPDKNTVILEYSVGDSSSCLWVITQSAHKLFRLPDRKTLQDQVEPFRFALSNPDQTNIEFITRGGYTLYKQLLEPAGPYLTKKSKLVIIPDGILNYLPFEVLLTDNKGIGAGNSFSGLPYLVKKYPVSYGQSASVLKSLLSGQKEVRLSDPGNKKLVAFGDPVYQNSNDTSQTSLETYKRLDNSGKEIENIASFFKKGNADTYLRNDATEENVKRDDELKKFNYVHFATHGFIDETKPDFSSLVLTQDKNSEEDGFLQATEIFNLKLNADLVVLSACQTGLGKLVRGEGMVGLTRAFMYAGSPTVMVSLWSVSDASTATLMGEFYRNLVKEKLDKTDALRKAQLFMLGNEKFAHPFYWAPFVLIGDWR
jgi:CHAT domain-containing protein/tetratricopeptide (TPR) repeat protein